MPPVSVPDGMSQLLEIRWASLPRSQVEYLKKAPGSDGNVLEGFDLARSANSVAILELNLTHLGRALIDILLCS